MIALGRALIGNYDMDPVDERDEDVDALQPGVLQPMEPVVGYDVLREMYDAGMARMRQLQEQYQQNVGDGAPHAQEEDFVGALQPGFEAEPQPPMGYDALRELHNAGMARMRQLQKQLPATSPLDDLLALISDDHVDGVRAALDADTLAGDQRAIEIALGAATSKDPAIVQLLSNYKAAHGGDVQQRKHNRKQSIEASPMRRRRRTRRLTTCSIK